MKSVFFSMILGLSLSAACSEEFNESDDEAELRVSNNGVGTQSDSGSAEEDMGSISDSDIVERDMTEDLVDLENCLQEEQCFKSFPFQIVDSTLGGESRWDSYGCEFQTDESGPERVYKVVLEEAGFLAAEITEEGVDVDVDVHLLSTDDNGACIDRGHFSAAGFLEAGSYYLSVDTWVDEEGLPYPGDFELSVNLTRPSDFIDRGINADLAEEALSAFSHAWEKGDTKRLEYSLIDFSLHSSLKRQWVVHLSTNELLFHLHVAHGEASVDGDDLGYSTLFSNIPQSHQSSLGMIKTAEPYTGDYGYSMRLDGLEPGFNDLVRPRDIVVHPWNGSAQSIIDSQGWVVPTWGCAALDPDITTAVVDQLSGGTLMFFWSPEGNWRQDSTYF